MKYIRIVFRDRTEITLPIEKAEKLLDNPNQLIKINDDKGEWTGETINKSEIIHTSRDFQKEKDEDKTPQLEEKQNTPQEISSLLDRYKPKFLKEE